MYSTCSWIISLRVPQHSQKVTASMLLCVLLLCPRKGRQTITGKSFHLPHGIVEGSQCSSIIQSADTVIHAAEGYDILEFVLKGIILFDMLLHINDSHTVSSAPAIAELRAYLENEHNLRFHHQSLDWTNSKCHKHRLVCPLSKHTVAVMLYARLWGLLIVSISSKPTAVWFLPWAQLFLCSHLLKAYHTRSAAEQLACCIPNVKTVDKRLELQSSDDDECTSGLWLRRMSVYLRE